MGENRGPSAAEVVPVPKIDLHRHLLGSIRPKSLWELSRRYGLDVGRLPLAEFRDVIVHREPPLDLGRYIQPWKVFREAIRDPEDVRRIASEAAEDARLDGVKYVEFRSSLPGMPVTDGRAPQTRIPADEYLDAIRGAFAAVPGVVCRLVASVPRHAVGPVAPAALPEYAGRFLEVVARFPELIIGVDLTGLERGWPARLFRDLFTEARSAGLPITIHAGETEGPEDIWTAIQELGATRIGHGTSAPQDPNLVEELIRRGVVLEVCPTATWLLGRSAARNWHPVLGCKPPVPFVICTDNPTLNATTLSQELLGVAGALGADPESFLASQFRRAAEAAFAPVALASAGR
jgi:adenosine deaminase